MLKLIKFNVISICTFRHITFIWTEYKYQNLVSLWIVLCGNNNDGKKNWFYVETEPKNISSKQLQI